MERLVTSQVIVMGGDISTQRCTSKWCVCVHVCIYMHVHTHTHAHTHTHIPLLATPILKRGLGPS